MNGGRRKGRTFPIRRSNDDCRSAVRQDFDDGALFPTKKSKGSFCRGFAANHMNMKTSTRKRIGRVGILAVLALLLLVCFASCAPNNAPKVTLSYDGDTFLSVAENQDQHALKVTQFKELADLLVATFNPDSFDNREMLVAAWRGYDMLAEDFDDTKINETDEERAERDRGDRADLAAAVKVIAKANELAEEKVSVDYTVLNKADLDVLINAFRTKVDVGTSSGFMDKILSGIGSILRWLTNTLCFGSYLAGICVFAVIIEILMLPFAIKQQKNSIRQAKLRPKEMAIKNKYKGRNDQPTMQKMQQEIQELYQRENFSPYSGCLPLLIQLPIIMALYSIIIDPLHYVMGQTAGMSQALTTFATASRAAGGLGCVFGNTNGSILLLSELKSAGVAAFESVSNFRFFENSEEIFTALSGISGKIPSFSIGGINIATRYVDGGRHGFWRDEHLRIEGDAAAHLHELFRSDWLSAGGEELQPLPEQKQSRPSNPSHPLQIIHSAEGPTRHAHHRAIIEAICSARHNIRISTPYLLPPPALLEAICIAARSGVEVELLIPARSDVRIAGLAAEAFVRYCVQQDVKVYRYRNGFLHSKLITIDESVAIVGSANLDYRSLCYNLEASVAIYSPALVREYNSRFYTDLALSEPVSRLQRPTISRLLAEGLARLLAPLL